MKQFCSVSVLVLLVALFLPGSAVAAGKCDKNFQECIDDLMREFKTRGWSGILFGNSQMTPGGEAIPDDLHILVNEVVADGPAAGSGLQRGDILISINGKKYNDLAVYTKVRAKMKVGDKVTYKVKRGTEEKEATVTLGEAPATTIALWLGDYILENYFVVHNEMIVQ